MIQIKVALEIIGLLDRTILLLITLAIMSKRLPIFSLMPNQSLPKEWEAHGDRQVSKPISKIRLDFLIQILIINPK